MERNASDRFNSNSGRFTKPPQSNSGIKRPSPLSNAFPGFAGPASKQANR